MFYPVDSLKRGGRFYLCWVADSWPLRFATITHRQLWSQDIRRICDDLLVVMTNESGRPANRFSLRLSSQLMRGLVRLYQRKVTVFLGELCMINAHVTKNVNKRWNIHEIDVSGVERQIARLPELPPPQLVVQEEPENEQRIEEIIQRSGNIVGNIEEITLKESTVPQVLLPPNDGFGEENPEQAMQLLKDQTVEMMLVQDGSAIQHSGLDLLALDITDRDKSHDKSRLAPHEAAQMERISEIDVTLFRKSTDNERLTMGGLEKDVPEIPEILLPDLPVPQPEIQMEEPPMEVNPANAIPDPEQEKRKEAQNLTTNEASPDVIVLEPLEEQPQAKKRRWRSKVIIDKKKLLDSDLLRSRIGNPFVDLRFEDSLDDVADTRVPVEILFRRLCHAGYKVHGHVGWPLTRLAQINMGVYRYTAPDREMEVAARHSERIRPTLGMIVEEETPAQPQLQIEQPTIEPEIGQQSFFQPNVTVPEHMDISDLPTQKLVEEIIESQAHQEAESRKRTSCLEMDSQSKRQRMSGYVSFRQSQQLALERSEIIAEVEKENLGVANIPSIKVSSDANVLKERDTNIQPHAIQERDTYIQTPQAIEKSLTVMLEEVGLADLHTKSPEEKEQPIVSQTQRFRRGSESSETPLGSLDRTKVSLGSSDLTTDSKRFIRDQWGTEGTMIKILRKVKAGLKPLTVKRLIAEGPVIPGYRAVMAGRCFSSILKLKQHGFITIEKNSETLEIVDIWLGPKFDHLK